LSAGADDFYFFVVPPQFSQGIGEWPENQILIPDWTYFHCHYFIGDAILCNFEPELRFCRLEFAECEMEKLGHFGMQ